MSEAMNFQTGSSARPPEIPPVHKKDKHDRGRRLYWPPILSLLAVFGAIAGLVAVSQTGIPPLFGPEQAVLHGAVIIAIAIVGAAFFAVRLQSMLTERRAFRSTNEDIADAGESIFAAQEDMIRIDALFHKLKMQEKDNEKGRIQIKQS